MHTETTERRSPAREGAASFVAHWGDVLKDAAKQWVADRIPTLGSSLAYYTLFSLAPLVLFAVALIGFAFGQDRAREGVIQELRDTLGDDVAGAIETVLSNASAGGAATVTAFGLVVLLFGASGAFVELQSALNQVWKVKESPSGGVWAFLRARLLSISAVVCMGFLLLVSLVLSAALSIVGKFFAGALIWQVVNTVLSLAMVTLVFALVFRWLPDAEVRWSDVWGAALVTAILFTLGKYLFGLYLAQAGVTSMYGSAASVVVVLLWVYYSSMILLFGAEVAHSHAVLARRD